jgi:hypothetical protein
MEIDNQNGLHRRFAVLRGHKSLKMSHFVAVLLYVSMENKDLIWSARGTAKTCVQKSCLIIIRRLKKQTVFDKSTCTRPVKSNQGKRP